jgi:hypothetical protein
MTKQRCDFCFFLNGCDGGVRTGVASLSHATTLAENWS